MLLEKVRKKIWSIKSKEKEVTTKQQETPQEEVKSMVEEKEDKEGYYKYSFTHSLCGKMRIHEIKGKVIDTNSTMVCIKDIGVKGLHFDTDLKIPMINDAVFSFKTIIFHEEEEFFGTLVECEELETGYYRYHVTFIPSKNMSDQELFHLLNRLSINKRNKKKSVGCSMCSLETVCFKSSDMKQKEYNEITNSA